MRLGEINDRFFTRNNVSVLRVLQTPAGLPCVNPLAHTILINNYVMTSPVLLGDNSHPRSPIFHQPVLGPKSAKGLKHPEVPHQQSKQRGRNPCLHGRRRWERRSNSRRWFVHMPTGGLV